MSDAWTDEKSPWEVLGVSEDADQPQIKKAYHKAALSLHPDRNIDRDTTHEFLLVQRAYEILSSKAPYVPSKGFDLHANFATMFSNLLMVHAFRLELELADVWSCEEREFLLEDFGPCLVCLGMGKRSPSTLCQECFGVSRFSGEDCSSCFGNGFKHQKERTCEFCLGKGKTKLEKRLCLELGPQLRDGQTYGLSSCLSVCKIYILEHPLYKRLGELDLEISVDIIPNKTNAFDFEFFGGERLKFFASKEQSKEGNNLLLRGRGLRTKEGKRGNIRVHLK
ncbi:chaperone protein DnaJ [Tokyovirus A1]|uniref:chaperone protein DnaJ n=1 Tax=Tokyovirus A1 TaxID=1826170 RepID=UPI0007A97136|nr:chaperone protein DnaJ [Tokyovirus A1]BAU80184.1 chaperone protein DnaJ [Tokyovirus A1]